MKFYFKSLIVLMICSIIQVSSATLLFIRSLDRSLITVDVDVKQKIQHLYDQVSEQTGIPVEEVRLITDGKILDPKDTIQDKGLDATTVIHFVRRRQPAAVVAPVEAPVSGAIMIKNMAPGASGHYIYVDIDNGQKISELYDKVALQTGIPVEEIYISSERGDLNREDIVNLAEFDEMGMLKMVRRTAPVAVAPVAVAPVAVAMLDAAEKDLELDAIAATQNLVLIETTLNRLFKVKYTKLLELDYNDKRRNLGFLLNFYKQKDRGGSEAIDVFLSSSKLI